MENMEADCYNDTNLFDVIFDESDRDVTKWMTKDNDKNNEERTTLREVGPFFFHPLHRRSRLGFFFCSCCCRRKVAWDVLSHVLSRNFTYSVSRFALNGPPVKRKRTIQVSHTRPCLTFAKLASDLFSVGMNSVVVIVDLEVAPFVDDVAN